MYPAGKIFKNMFGKYDYSAATKGYGTATPPLPWIVTGVLIYVHARLQNAGVCLLSNYSYITLIVQSVQ